MAAAGLVEAARAADPEVADAWIDILTAVARIPDRDDHRKAAQVLELSGTKGRFGGLVALGHARVERFLAAALDAHDPSADPFATAWRPAARKGGPRHPDVTVDLSAVDGNANAIIGKVSEALRRARVPAEEIAEFRAEARSGTFDKVLGTVLRWVDVELGRDDEHEEGMDEDEDTSFAP